MVSMTLQSSLAQGPGDPDCAAYGAHISERKKPECSPRLSQNAKCQQAARTVDGSCIPHGLLKTMTAWISLPFNSPPAYVSFFPLGNGFTGKNK